MTTATCTISLGSAANFSDPKRMPKGIAQAQSIALNDYTDNRSSTVSSFWTPLANNGVDDNTDFTADTYKTLVDITSGAGVLCAVVGPTAGGAETTTFEITIDGGTPVEITRTCASGDRAFLGHLISKSAFTASGGPNYFPDGLASDKQGFDGSGTLLTLVTPNHLLFWGTSLLEYTESLKVRIKHSANVTGTANQERRSGAMYYDGYH